jgi:hypothetical protein
MSSIIEYFRYICVSSFAFLSLSALFSLTTASEALACGDETGLSCSSEEDDARYMLKNAIVAVQKDEAKALLWFTEMSHGFRTEDLYVFCIGPDHMMDAHPDPKINHTDILQVLIDTNGFHFGEVMWSEAKEGRMSDITYLWPRLETSKPSVKHTMYTKVKDQICAVGYYE